MNSDETFSYGPNDETSFISRSGQRIGLDKTKYIEAKTTAETELLDFPDLVFVRIKQLLAPNELSKADVINLFAAQLFPKREDQIYFRLAVRFLSVDMPSEGLSSQEEKALNEALKKTGSSLEMLKQKSREIFPNY